MGAVEQAYQIMPSLSDDDFSALKADIAARGVLVPVEYDEDGNILDGHHRVQACKELGIADWPRFIRKGLSEDEKRAHAMALNLARRHLSKDQRASLWADMRAAGMSYRQIAEADGTVRDTTVMRTLSTAANAAVAQPEAVVGKDGKRRSPVRTAVPEPEQEPDQSPGLGAEAEPDPQPAAAYKPVRTAYVDPTPEGRQEAINTAKQIKKETQKVRGTQGTGENEWYTPERYILAARDVLGGIDLDPATSEIANETVGAGRIFTIDDDGLSQEWDGHVWMNPPYAQPFIAQFCAKLRDEYEAGRVTEAICLTHNYTDTEWFHNLQAAASAICFTRGRVKFESPGGGVAAPTQGQAFFYLGDYPRRFAGVFCQFGFVVVPS